MSNKSTKNNHYVSIGFAKNFRTQKSDMWKLDCISGHITNRSTSAERLFAGRKLWSQDLEDAYNTLENQVIPLIDEILLLPFKPVASSNAVEIEVLPDKYKKVLDYILQTTILQRANTPKSKEVDEEIHSKFFSSELVLPAEKIYLIRYNQIAFKKTPLVLIDNCVSAVPTPKVNNTPLEYSLAFIIPISPFNCLFFGNRKQLDFFAPKHINPHNLNIYRILQENKQCQIASQNKQYLEILKSEYQHHNLSSAITVFSQRNYI